MSISGVLTQKPDSPDPVAGAIARFTVEVKSKKNKPGETWNKLKNERDGFGEPYKILKCDRIEDYTHPQHGTFHQFSLLIAPQEDAAGAVGEASSNGVSAPAAASDREETIARAVAFKGAVELVSRIPFEPEKPFGDLLDLVAMYTDGLLPIVKGETDPPTSPEPQPQQSSDPIPF